jgi:hypothetical protein
MRLLPDDQELVSHGLQIGIVVDEHLAPPFDLAELRRHAELVVLQANPEAYRDVVVVAPGACNSSGGKPVARRSVALLAASS